MPDRAARSFVQSSRGVASLYALVPALVVLGVGPALAVTAPSSTAVAVPDAVVATGTLVVAGGLALAVWGVQSFAAAAEAPSPVGRTATLVTDGALAHSRNPIYLGTVVAALGEAVALGSSVLAGYAAALWVVYHLLVVYREEPALATAFGAAYADYRESVPRWL
jgi:protein-S-isoprenylcysteine O-methyltransferase Ste14